MKLNVSKFKKHNFCNIDNSEAATRCSTQKMHSQKFCNIRRKTPTPESLSNKFAGSQACNYIKKRCENRRSSVPSRLPPRTANSPRTLILKNTFERLPLIIHTKDITKTLLKKDSTNQFMRLRDDYQ